MELYEDNMRPIFLQPLDRRVAIIGLDNFNLMRFSISGPGCLNSLDRPDKWTPCMFQAAIGGVSAAK